MDKKELDEIRQDLLERRANLTGRIEEEREKIDRSENEFLDATELAQDYNLRERITGIVDQYELEIIEIDDALRRIDEGAYGTCENCGNEIPLERLRAMPQARLCVRCQAEAQTV